MPRFPRGAKPSPRHKLLGAMPFQPVGAAPAQFAPIPSRTSFWLNNEDGDCVTAEEALAKAVFAVLCGLPELFVSDDEVRRFITQHGFANGATLTEVMDVMKGADGLAVNGTKYHDGDYLGVNYSDEALLRAAIATGPVKVAIDAAALPSSAGPPNGWHSFGGRPGQFPDTDHCIAYVGYGTAAFCFAALGVPVPAGVDPNKPDCYLAFTWNSFGVVDHPWIMSTTTEAWVRSPTTPGQVPAPPPDPPPLPPNPNPPPPPTPEKPMNLQLSLNADLVPPHTVNVRAVSYTLTGKGDPPKAGLAVPPEVYALLWQAVREYGLKAVAVAWPVIRADLAAGKAKDIPRDVWAALKAAVLGGDEMVGDC